jgi:hypothetical protein
MKYTLLPDSRRPNVALVCDEDGQPIEYPDGKYKDRWPFSYEPSETEKELRRAICAQFPNHDIRGISPKKDIGRFECHFQLVGTTPHLTP